MAQKVQIILEDDLDGSAAAETVLFGLDGATYEIDLNEKHAASLRKALSRYVEKGRRTSKPRGRSRSAKGSKRNAEIRDWARRNGHEIGDRGRIPTEVAEAFESANAA